MSLYFTEVVPDSLPKSIVEMTEGPFHSVRSDEPEGKTRLAWREYLAHHHLPPRVQVLAMPDGAAVVPAGTVDAVSYTHLDVYKRQDTTIFNEKNFAT